jgi:hypothetical protein
MGMKGRPIAAGLALALVATGVAPAEPLFNDIGFRVNEIYPAGPGEAFVELLSVVPEGEDPPQASYSMVSYDADGAEVGSQTFTKPYPFAGRTTPFVFGNGGDAPALPLAPGAGKVCFKVTTLTDPIHCLKYDNVAAGQSVQRQPCGRAGTAAPTRGQENTLIDAVCAGRRPCDDPRFSYPGALKMKVIGKKTQDVDKFALKFRLSKDGDVSVRGSALVGPRRLSRPGPKLQIWGPTRLEAKAGVPVRLKNPLTRTFRRAVKRGARHGETAELFAISVARDMNCNPLRFHSSRHYLLKP